LGEVQELLPAMAGVNPPLIRILGRAREVGSMEQLGGNRHLIRADSGTTGNVMFLEK